MSSTPPEHDEQPEQGTGQEALPAAVTLALDLTVATVRKAMGKAMTLPGMADLPRTAAGLPMRGLGLAFEVAERVQRGAADLQQRAEQLRALIETLRGEAENDDTATYPSPAPAEAGAAAPGEGAETATRPATDRVAATDSLRRPAGDKPTTKRAAPGPRRPGKRTAQRPNPEAAAAGAPGTARDAVKRAEAATPDSVVPGSELRPEQLPVADYDHLSIGSLRSRLPRLDRDQLVQLLGYERAHADRLPVVTLFENRIAKLEHAGTGAPKAAPRRTTRKPAAEGGPDAGDAQAAAEDFGSNSPHP